MDWIVVIIVLAVLALQWSSYRNNFRRMGEYKEIFSQKESWRVQRDSMGGVSGISGEGNSVYSEINDSINAYLRNNRHRVIDFAILKDAVDRNCDRLEDEISTQIPTPLYFGLAGTMIGVIVGLLGLLHTGGIEGMISASGESVSQSASMVADGIHDLLAGVAWAMVGSVFGIVLTTLGSIQFKRVKKEEEEGRSEFLSWMQAELLPSLSTDSSTAIHELAENLNSFNSGFASNTANLNDSLDKVNQSYEMQFEILDALQKIKIEKVAKFNVEVLRELQNCTGKLERFNDYLNSVNEYTYTIKEFTDRFNAESARLRILEEIRDFFARHKGELGKEVADAEDTLKKALERFAEATEEGIQTMRHQAEDQLDGFRKYLKESQEALTEMALSMRDALAKQLETIPDMVGLMAKMTEIPEKMEAFAVRLEASNKMIAEAVRSNKEESKRQTRVQEESGKVALLWKSIPCWVRWLVLVGFIVIALNALYSMLYKVAFAIFN